MDFLKFIYIVFITCNIFVKTYAQEMAFLSPDKKTKLSLTFTNKISYRVNYKDKVVLNPSTLTLQLSNGEILGEKAHLIGISNLAVKKILTPILKEKRAKITDIYTNISIKFKEKFSVEFRIYNDGLAYRFITNFDNELIIKDEGVTFNLPENSILTYPTIKKRDDADIFHTSFESTYKTTRLDSIDKSTLIFSPILAEIDDSLKLIITESDIVDYPGMFLQKGENTTINGVFAPYPKTEKVVGGDGFRQAIVTERENYIAKTIGMRNFPWRIIGIAPTDKSILENDIVYRLSTESKIKNTTWIKPGQSTEEWITDLNLYGVDFKTGLNTATYKYYVDFAKKFGLEYVMLDAGWSDVNDLFKITKGLDVKEIIRYAKSKNIGIILWTEAETMQRQMPKALDLFKKWGVKIVMTDFIDRDDQKAINFIAHFADEAAKRELMVMIHGASKPAGFSRTHPNALTRESVMGSEYNAWSSDVTPIHDLKLPFLRQFSGTMDYEPGIMQNTTKKQAGKLGMEKVTAQGTIMHQMAMFLIYESPLQLFSGNISDALKEPELLHFFGKLPTVWDETNVLDAKFPNYILEARRNGKNWYLGGINDWSEKNFEIKLDFLENGKYEAIICADGINANRNAQDYKITKKLVKKGDKLFIHLASGGGYLVWFRRVK
jgi:alpha-glucosidase